MPRAISIEALTIEIEAHEPLQQPLLLYQPYEVEQILLPDNANCLAVQALLRMCDLEFQVEPRWNAENMSPTNKVPVIKSGAFVMSGFDDIVAFLNRRGVNLSKDLQQDDIINLRAYISLISNVLYHAELYICWCDENTYNNITKIRHGSVYPWPLNHLMNWQKRSQICKKLSALGWTNKTSDEVLEEVKKCCDALSSRLEDKMYFFGDKPNELDALVFGHVFSIITTPLKDNALANIVRSYPSLVKLIKNIENRYFQRKED